MHRPNGSFVWFAIPLLSLLPNGWALSIGAAVKRSTIPDNVSIDDLNDWVESMRASQAVRGAIEEYASENRVVVAMTTIPPRMKQEHLEPVLDAMLAQSWPVAALHLSIPYVYNRTGETYRIPQWLWEKRGVSISRCEDMGPGTHLLNALKLEQDPRTFIVLVDDDHIYHTQLVENLMRSAVAHPGAAIAAQGFLSVPGLPLTKTSPRYLHDQGFPAGPVLVSYLGVVYQRIFFDDTIYDYSKVSDKCRYQDDMWFSAHLAKKGIQRFVLNAALGVHELKELHLGPSSLTFWEEKPPRQVSDECNDSLLKLYEDLWTKRRRVVLSINGLPPLAGLERAIASAEQRSAWNQVLLALRKLPVRPDLVYLCSEKSRSSTPEEERVLGAQLSSQGLALTGSSGCQAYAPEARITQLLRAPLEAEGDADTVLILGSFLDIVREGARLPDLAACAIVAASEIEQERHPASAESLSPWCHKWDISAVTVGGFSASVQR